MVQPEKKTCPLRFDQKMVASWIPQGSRVLGLGCGEGHLLEYLKYHKAIKATGIERDEKCVTTCIAKGLSVLQGDINTEVRDYADNSFDFVILSQTLQQIYHPSELLSEILRVGRRGIVSFPNFSHWSIRWQLLVKGKAPVSPQLPYQWHDTPNIRVITLKDFRNYAREVGFRIFEEIGVNTHTADHHGRIVKRFKDLVATYGLFLIGK